MLNKDEAARCLIAVVTMASISASFKTVLASGVEVRRDGQGVKVLGERVETYETFEAFAAAHSLDYRP